MANRRGAGGKGSFGAGPWFTFSWFRVSGRNVLFKLQVIRRCSGIADAFAEFFVIIVQNYFCGLKMRFGSVADMINEEKWTQGALREALLSGTVHAIRTLICLKAWLWSPPSKRTLSFSPYSKLLKTIGDLRAASGSFWCIILHLFCLWKVFFRFPPWHFQRWFKIAQVLWLLAFLWKWETFTVNC